MIVKSARAVFTLAVLLLLLGGLVIVVTQVAGLIAGQGGWLTGVSETVEPPTLIAASIAGLLAFLLSYQRGAAVGEGVTETTEATAEPVSSSR
jgi:hypothetical protein